MLMQENGKWKMKQGIIVVIIALFLIPYSLALPASPAFAQGFLPDCEPVPGEEGTETCGAEHIIELLVNIYNWLLGFAALIGLLMIIWSGVQMLLVSVFEISPNELLATPIESAKLTLLRAVIGLIIIFLAWVIVNTVLALLGVVPDTAVGELLQRYGLLK